MPYEVRRAHDGRPKVVLCNEPPYCHALQAAPAALEPKLRQGRWLVLALAAWSVPDIRAIQVALDAAKHFGGAVRLGLRPFDDPAEHHGWAPELENEVMTPAWLFFEDGTLKQVRIGVMTKEALVTAMADDET